MDESWRRSMGGGYNYNNAPSGRRRSVTEEDRSSSSINLHPEEDFDDVFGGPPRTVLHRRSAAVGFYDEVFGQPPVRSGGRRNLPHISIPSHSSSNSSSSGGRSRRAGVPGQLHLVRTEEGFYDDILGSSNTTAAAAAASEDWRLRSRSTTNFTNSSNNRSYKPNSSPDQNTNFDHPRIFDQADDAVLSHFTSRLRPITIPTRQRGSSPSTLSGGEEESTNRTLPINNIQLSTTFVDMASHKGSSTNFFRPYHHRPPSAGFSYGNLSPSVEMSSYCPNCKKQPSRVTDNIFPSSAGSPSSVISSASFLDPMTNTSSSSYIAPLLERELEKKVVIEVKQERRETEGAAAVDEAIAWAKEKFWNQTPASNKLEEVRSGENSDHSKEEKESTDQNNYLLGKGDRGTSSILQHFMEKYSTNEY